MTGGLPAAGWYHDGRGLRWWDGQAWGPYAPFPPAPPSAGIDPVLLATLVHLGFFFGGFIGPLVVRLTEGRKHEFVRHHATEALNANLTALLAYVGYLVGFGVGVGTGTPAAIFIGFGIAGVAGFGLVVQMIIGAVRASQGRWYRYPAVIRFVPGALPKGHDAPVVTASRLAASPPTWLPPGSAPGPAGPTLPGPVVALADARHDLAVRWRAWLAVTLLTMVITLGPYFVAVGVNDLVFHYDFWNEPPPTRAADLAGVWSFVGSLLLATIGMTVGWAWMAALASDTRATLGSCVRRGTGPALRRAWYTAPALVVAMVAVATMVGAPFAVAVLGPLAFGAIDASGPRGGFVQRAFGRLLAIGAPVAVVVFSLYLLWAIGGALGLTGTIALVLTIMSGLALFATLAHTAAAIGVLYRADEGGPQA